MKKPKPKFKVGVVVGVLGGCILRPPSTAIEQWARLLWLSKYSEENIIGAFTFAAYFDASGKNEHPVLFVGGAVAPVWKWIRFEREWTETLRLAGVKEFHATDFAASVGEFKEWKGKKDKRSRFIRELHGVMKRNTNKFFSVGIELGAWRSVNKEYLLEECCHSPYALCGFAVVKQLVKWAKKRPLNEIEIIFEEGDIGWGGLKKLCKGIGVEPVQLPKKKAIPCQVSDLIAWKSRIAFTNGIAKLDRFMKAAPTLEQLETLLKENESLKNVLVRPGTPGVFSRKSLIKTCADSKIPRRPLRGI